MKSKTVLSLTLTLALLMSGCTAAKENTPSVPSSDAGNTPYVETDTTDMFTNRDLSPDYDESSSAHIMRRKANAYPAFRLGKRVLQES